MIFHRTIDRGERWSAVLPALVVAVVVAAGFSWRDIALAQTAPQKLNISMSSTGMPSIQLFIAREKGFFRQLFIDLARESAKVAGR